MEQVYVEAANDAVLYPKHLPNQVRIGIARGRMGRENEPQRGAFDPPTESFASYRDFRARALYQAEREYLMGLMSLTRGNIPEACRVSRVSQSRLYELLKKHGLNRSGQVNSVRFPEKQEFGPNFP
jgi:two-component system NtrC family response regulator